MNVVVIGAINWDTTFFVHNFPKPGEEVVVQRVIQVPGGKAGNTAVAAARILGRNRVAVFGGLGNDSIATKQLDTFEKEGVIVTGLKRTPELHSGQAFIVVNEMGENTVYTHLGANASIKPEDFDDPNRRELFSRATVVAIMDPPFETSVRLSKDAKQFGKRVVYDPGVKSEMRLSGLQPVLRNVNYLLVNESETKNLTGTEDPDRAAKKLIQENPQLKVVTKLGRKGCIIFDAVERTQCEAPDLHALGMKPVNTVGCGDAFLGAFVAGLSEGLSDLEALRWANCAAGLKATKPETRGGPDRDTLLKYMNQVKIRN